MKKFVAFTISVFTAVVLCVGLAGCGDAEKDTINYTATAPAIYYERAEAINGEPQYTGYELLFSTEEQDDFTNYYKDNLSGGNLYLLNYGFELQNGNFHFYDLYRGTENDKIFALMSFRLYDNELGVWAPQKKPTGLLVSLDFKIFITPTEINDKDNMVLEFGKSEEKFYGYNKYINLYAGGKCFATCYFDRGVRSIEEEWFENYFANNLVLV